MIESKSQMARMELAEINRKRKEEELKLNNVRTKVLKHEKFLRSNILCNKSSLKYKYSSTVAVRRHPHQLQRKILSEKYANSVNEPV